MAWSTIMEVSTGVVRRIFCRMRKADPALRTAAGSFPDTVTPVALIWQATPKAFSMAFRWQCVWADGVHHLIQGFEFYVFGFQIDTPYNDNKGFFIIVSHGGSFNGIPGIG